MKNKFEKSDFKTGMTIETNENSFAKVLLDTENGDVLAGTAEGIKEAYMPLSCFNDNLEYRELKIIRVFSIGHNDRGASIKRKGKLLWERKEEEKTILTLDDIEYSESTLRSIIKKAQNL